IVTFVIFFIIPADPAALIAGKAPRPIDIQRAAHFIGTDKPVWYQYGKFVGRLTGVHWDRQEGQVWNIKFETPSLGTSFATRQDVNHIVFAAEHERRRDGRGGEDDVIHVLASLVLGGAILWMLIALPLGILSALRPRSTLDRGGM